MIGLSTSGSISFGCALVAGRKRVPSPAAGKTALRTARVMPRSYRIYRMLDPAYVRDHSDDLRTALRHRGADAEALLAPLAELDARRRALIPQVERLKHDQNAASAEIAK